MFEDQTEIGVLHHLRQRPVCSQTDRDMQRISKPGILFDQRDQAQFDRAVATANEIMKFCLEMGGALTGEHGVGMEKTS